MTHATAPTNGHRAALVARLQPVGVFPLPDFLSAGEFPYQPQTASALRFPYAIDIDPPDVGGTMVVADTANNRVLVWVGVPVTGGVPADRVLGQPDFGTDGENSGNNRVMLWELP
jgi:hypothetical protein